MNKPTHNITITATARYPHGQTTSTSVSIDGEGDIDHFITALQAALVGAGYLPETVGRIRFDEETEPIE